jgi:hypothetical protein
MTTSQAVTVKIGVKNTIQNYEDMKGQLKECFDSFVKSPESFGATAEMAKEINEMNSLKAKGLWVLFKKQFKLKLTELEMNDLAELLNQDLTEDNVEVLSKEALQRILKHPESEEYKLEPEMIEAIKTMSSKEKDALFKATANSFDIETESESAATNKVLYFLKELWENLSPVVDKVLDSLIAFGLKSLGSLIDQKLSKEISDNITDAMQEIGQDTVDASIDTVSGVIESGLSNEDALEVIKSEAENIRDSVLNNTTKMVEKNSGYATDKIVDLLSGELGVLSVTTTDEPTVLGQEAEA